MSAVKVSPKFQIVIPKEVREAVGLKAGARVHIVVVDNRIQMIPVEPVKNLRGFLRGIDTRIERDEDRV